MKLHDLPPYLRPREKLVARGVNGLSDAELLALILQTGYQGKNIVEMCQRILATHSLNQLFKLNQTALAKIKGLGPSKAAMLVAIKEVALRLQTPAAGLSINQPKDIAQLSTFLLTKKQEYLIAFYLNARYQVIAQETISIGTLDSSLIHPREVFAPALTHRASSLILVHNHPSGDPQPSDEDVTTTEKIVEVGELLDIPLLDHLVVAKNGWKSLKQLNLM